MTRLPALRLKHQAEGNLQAVQPDRHEGRFLDLTSVIEYDVVGSCNVGDGTSYLSQQSI